ncbi:type II secretion system protein [Alkalihalobacillus sp. BA299]|uniref:type II secretion system protein n=1 Tax=Alkalihalobacillus sp. BA299 TaxID=2815938 RepID=UPI001ADABD1C|nr:type II secretion system protein [Alkalihalobacillus sp. BA299]
MKRDRGFSLLEVITSVFIVSIMSASLFPAMIKIYTEREAIREFRIANNNITEAIQVWLFEHTLPSGNFAERNTIYQWSILTLNDGQVKFCLTWSSKNGRDYEQCGHAKK